MKNYKIYTFWLGNDKRKKELENNIIQINKKIFPYEIILGPTKDDHEYLMKYYKFYRNSFNKQVYSFCSDVWRLWILNNNRNNFYIDSGCLINVYKFKDYLDSIDKTKDLYFVESKTRIWFGFIYISSNSPYIEYMDYVYKQRKLLKNPHSYIAIPDHVFMKILVHKFHSKFGYENIKKNPGAIFGSCKFFDVRQKDWIIKNGSTNSWRKGKGDNKEYVKNFWLNSWDNFDNSKCKFYDWFTWIYYRLTPLVFIKKTNKNDTNNSVIKK